MPLLDLDALPAVSLEDADATAICDPDPSAFGDVFCYDGLELGHRALRTVMTSVDRLYLNRPACASGICIPDQVNRVRVIGWSGDEAYTVLMDWDANTITVPIPSAAAAWPAAISSIAPAVRRPSLDNAPAEIANREPYPFCGRAQPIGLRSDTPEKVARVNAINSCFFDGVLAGRPVEMIEITAITEQPAMFRFGGPGPVIRYLEKREGPIVKRGWYRAEGPIVLGGSVYWGISFNLEPVKVD